MKKTIVVLAVLFSVNNIVTAQNFAIGLKAGANLSKISGSSFSDEYKLSYHAGAFMSLDFNKKIGIQPEVLLSQAQAQTVSSGVILPSGSQNYKLSYLSIPLLLRYKFSKVIILNVGPQYSILLNKDDNAITNGQNAFKDGDFAMVAGLQLDFKYLRFYGRYNIGLNDINDLSSSEKWKNEQIQLGLGFRF
ncbi:MAG: porin family protein [Chitinophagaceae bacterium]